MLLFESFIIHGSKITDKFFMSSSSLKGFSNLVSGTSKRAPKNPAWLNKTDVIHSSQSELPSVDLSSADLGAAAAAVTNQSKRILKQARGSSPVKRRKAITKKIVKRRVVKKTKKLLKKPRKSTVKRRHR